MYEQVTLSFALPKSSVERLTDLTSHARKAQGHALAGLSVFSAAEFGMEGKKKATNHPRIG